ncbi:MAG: PilZ domain-containing protein [Candidatus Brocadia sp.]
MAEYAPNQNRRQYPRLNAPIYCRPARFTSPRAPLVNIGLGGIRVYSDKTFKVGERLEIELFLPDNSSITCNVKVVWMNQLGGSTAKYDVGLQFLEIEGDDLRHLAGILKQQGT